MPSVSRFFNVTIAAVFGILLAATAFSQTITLPATGTVKLKVTVPENTPANALLSLGGDFNSWDPSAAGFTLQKQDANSYTFTFAPYPIGKVLNFKITRGNWQTVEIAADGSNTENRRIVVTEDQQLVQLTVADWDDLNDSEAPSSIVGDVIFKDIELPTFKGQRKLRIYLPPDYHSSNKSYPVIYMPDGQNLFDTKTANAGEWQMDELMQGYASDNNPHNEHLVSIVVGIDHAGANRRAEYLPFDLISTSEQQTQTGSDFQKPLKGKGAVFADWLVNDLKPYIDRTYRTKPEREHTTMMGSSMGGLISCYTALRHQQTIAKTACYSSAFLKRLVANNMLDFVKHTGKQQPMKIHIDMGDNEFGLFGKNILLETKEVYDTLITSGFSQNEVRNQVIKGGTHDEPSWRSRTAEIIEWLNQ